MEAFTEDMDVCSKEKRNLLLKRLRKLPMEADATKASAEAFMEVAEASTGVSSTGTSTKAVTEA